MILDASENCCKYCNSKACVDTGSSFVICNLISNGTCTNLLQLPIIESMDVTDSNQSTRAPVKSLANKRSIQIHERPLCARAGDLIEFSLTVELQQGLHFTEGAPSACQLLLCGMNCSYTCQSLSQVVQCTCSLRLAFR